MKEAWWALAVVVLGLFGLVLLNLFGDITVTNQQDYTIMKNSVEAAMQDAIDQDAYKTGFCLCTNKLKNSDGMYVFNDKNDYQLYNATEGQKDCKSVEKKGYACDLLVGEVKINSEVFVENFIRRFSNNVKDNKRYKIAVKDIIEYPPKVSVEVLSTGNNNLVSGTFDDDDFNIRNKIDSILEYGSNQECISRHETGWLTCNSTNCKQYDQYGKETSNTRDVYKTVTSISYGTHECNKTVINQIVERTGNKGEYKVSYKVSKKDSCSGSNVILVLDASGSVTSFYGNIKEEALKFFKGLQSDKVKVGLVIFNTDVKGGYNLSLKEIKEEEFLTPGSQSRVDLGVQEALYQLGYIDQPFKRETTYSKKGVLTKKLEERSVTEPGEENYLIILGDGIYSKSYVQNIRKWNDERSNLKILSIGFKAKSDYLSYMKYMAGCGDDINKSAKVSCDNYYDYINPKEDSKGEGDTQLSMIFSQIQSEIVKDTKLEFTDTIGNSYTVNGKNNYKLTVDLLDPKAKSTLENTSYIIKLKDNVLRNSTSYISSMKIESNFQDNTSEVLNNPVGYKGCE